MQVATPAVTELTFSQEVDADARGSAFTRPGERGDRLAVSWDAGGRATATVWKHGELIGSISRRGSGGPLELPGLRDVATGADLVRVGRRIFPLEESMVFWTNSAGSRRLDRQASSPAAVRDVIGAMDELLHWARDSITRSSVITTPTIPALPLDPKVREMLGFDPRSLRERPR